MADNATGTPRTRGYLSEADKKRFTITAGVLGTIFLMAQFVLPMIIMVAFALGSGQLIDLDVVAHRDPYRATVWNNEVWFVETDSWAGGEATPGVLFRANLDDLESKEAVVRFSDDPPSLLVGANRLWLVSKNTLSEVKDGRAEVVGETADLADISTPFLFESRPAVLERWPDRLVLRVHDGETWQARGALTVVLPDQGPRRGLNRARAVAHGESLDVFLELGDTLFGGLWVPDSDSDVAWEMIGDSGEDWWPVSWRGRAAVLIAGASAEQRAVLLASRGEEGWTTAVLADRPHGDRIKAVAGAASGDLTVFLGFSHGITVRMLQFADDASLVRSDSFGVDSGGSGFFPGTMFLIIGVQYGGTILLPVILALILSGMMKRYRVRSYSTEDWTVSHASLARRALAQLVDVAVVAAPMIVSSIVFVKQSFFFDAQEPDSLGDVVAMMWPVFASLGWALLMLFVFAVVEGRTGLTPGKWVTRIRVLGTDLKPCGFGRALVRNLLKTVDGFFNFIVGIMVVALSENWQRVGDMAARTVVVDDRTWQQRPIAGRRFSRANGAAESDGG
jgi:uncharacterized RDD family membrane protein YckC